MSNKKPNIGLFGAFMLLFVLTQGAEAISFSHSGAILIPPSGTEGIAYPYPSIINVFGMTGTVTDVNVTLNGLSHTWPDDIDILLVGPGGQMIILMSDAGGPHDVTNLTMSFDDEAPSFPSNGNSLVGGSFKVSNHNGGGGPDDNFPGPAPAGPYGALLSDFDGTGPNGSWSLFVFDDEGADVGSIARGWSLDIATADITTVVAEPSTLVLLGAGLLGLAGWKRKAKR